MNVVVKALLIVMLAIMVPCHAASSSISAPHVLLITIDGVRWQEIFNGTAPVLYRGKQLSARQLLPNLYRLADGGMVIGAKSEFIASGPMHISLPGYLEIMRGHPSFDCQSNECNPIAEPTVADLFDTSAVFASWGAISKTVSSKPGRVIDCGKDYRPDELTIAAALNYLRHDQPEFMWVALGDTDEWAHAGNYQQYIGALKQADTFVGQVMRVVGNDYTVIITADHGRGLDWRNHWDDAESGKDWLMMSGRGVESKGFVKYEEVKSLSNILATVKELRSGRKVEGSLL